MATLLGPQATTDPQRAPLEHHDKMLKIRRLSDAIDLTNKAPSTKTTALQLQQLRKDRNALRATMPPLRVVSSQEPLTFKVNNGTSN